MARPDTTLRNMLIASREAGYVVVGAKAEGEKIELVYEAPKDSLPADLIQWKRKK